MNIYLVYIRDKRYFKGLDGKGKENRLNVVAMPPLGIMYLSSSLKTQGHNPTLFDQCHFEHTNEHIVSKMEEEKVRVLGISFLSNSCYDSARELAVLAKRMNSEITVIVGGPFATINADKMIRDCPEIDIVVRGEGEEALPDLLDNLAQLKDILGITYRFDGAVMTNPDRELIRDLDAIPFPDRNGLKINYLASLPMHPPVVLSETKSATVLSSRGCSYKCLFCCCPAIGRGRYRLRSYENVFAELKLLADQGYRDIHFADDHFLLDKERVERLCEEIISERLDIRWGCEGRVDASSQHLYKRMVDAGCYMLMLGIESGVQKSLEYLNKRQTLEDIRAAVSLAKRAGIKIVHGFFLLGIPGETLKDVKKTFRFIGGLNIDTFSFSTLYAFRGTPLWEKFVKKDVIDDDLDWYKAFPMMSISENVINEDVLYKIRSRMIKRLILYCLLRHPLKYFFLIKGFIKNLWAFRLVIKLLFSSGSTRQGS